MVALTHFLEHSRSYRFTTCPYGLTGSSYRPTGSPYGPTGFPYRLTGFPYRLTGSSYGPTGSPYRLTNSPYCLTNSPYRPTTSSYRLTNSPYCLTNSPYRCNSLLEPIVREFGVPFETVITLGDTFAQLGLARQKALADANTRLTPAWYEELQADVKKLRELPVNAVRQAENHQLTALRDEDLAEARRLLQSLYRAAPDALPGTSHPADLFGQKLYTAAGDSPEKLLVAVRSAASFTYQPRVPLPAATLRPAGSLDAAATRPRPAAVRTPGFSVGGAGFTGSVTSVAPQTPTVPAGVTRRRIGLPLAALPPAASGSRFRRLVCA